MGFLQRISWKIQSFMRGRYGMDKLSSHLYYAALLCWLISMFARIPALSVLFYAFAFYAIFRALSKNIGKRQKELYWYLGKTNKISAWFRGVKNRWADRKFYRYYKCKCGSSLRVPRGKGKIEITCPKCSNKFIRRT